MVEQIVKSDSKAYGYNYARLADIVKQGNKLPKMTTHIVEGQTFVFWYDEELKEWLQGAPLVVPEMRGMNAAQAMGSALTYARRYTAQMALGLACDDDTKLEKSIPQGGNKQTSGNNNFKVDFRQVREHLTEIASVERLNEYWKSLKLTEKQAAILKSDFAKRKEALGGDNGVER